MDWTGWPRRTRSSSPPARAGDAPLRWLLAQRVQRARTLLESTDDSVGLVAERSALGSEANLRHHFTRTVRVAPTEYRRTFRGGFTAP